MSLQKHNSAFTPKFGIDALVISQDKKFVHRLKKRALRSHIQIHAWNEDNLPSQDFLEKFDILLIDTDPDLHYLTDLNLTMSQSSYLFVTSSEDLVTWSHSQTPVLSKSEPPRKILRAISDNVYVTHSSQPFLAPHNTFSGGGENVG